MKTTLLVLTGCTLAMSLAASMAIAADIVGTVTDASGQAVSGSKISVAAQSGQIAGDAITDRQGRYAITGLQPGEYDIKLDPATANLKGDTAVSYLDSRGLTVNWAVGPSREALATAQLGTQQPAVSSMSPLESPASDSSSPPGCNGMTGPPCGPKSSKK